MLKEKIGPVMTGLALVIGLTVITNNVRVDAYRDYEADICTFGPPRYVTVRQWVADYAAAKAKRLRSRLSKGLGH